jgi:hypothetical protein
MQFKGKDVTERMSAFGITSLIIYREGAFVGYRNSVTGRHEQRDVPLAVAHWFAGVGK